MLEQYQLVIVKKNIEKIYRVSSLKAKKASLSNELYDYRKKIENILAQVG